MRKSHMISLLFLLMVLLGGCTRKFPSTFVMPKWDTQVSAPIFNHTYTLGELLGKDTVLVSNGDTTFIRSMWSSGVLAVSKDQPISSTRVGANLKIESIPTVSVAQSLGSFDINPPQPIGFLMKLSNIIDTTGVIGKKVPAPPISGTSDTLKATSGFDQFKQVTISSAILQYSVFNGYAAKISLPNGLMITDSLNNSLLTVRVPGDTLGAYQLYSATQQISNLNMPYNPHVILNVSSPGSTTPVTIRSDTLVYLNFALQNIKVTSALAKIPSQSPVVIDRRIGLVDSNKIISASIQSGNFSISIANRFDISSQVQLTIWGLKSSTGSPLTINVPLDRVGNKLNPNPGSTFNSQISLANYTLDLRDQNGNPTDSIHYTVSASIPGSGGQYVQISTGDSIYASIGLSNLQIGSLTGIVHLKNPISIPTDTQNIDLGDFRKKFNGSIRFSDSTQLALKIYLSGGFPFRAHLSIVPRNSTTNSTFSDSAVVDQLLNPGPAGNVIMLGRSFVNILNSFTGASGNLPDQLVISGSVIVNPDYNVGTITSSDSVYGSASILLPFDLGITNASYADSTDKPIFKEDVNKKLDYVDSGQVVFEINNGLPLGIKFYAELVDTTTHQVVLTLPKNGPLNILPATDFNPDGTVRTPVFSSNTISLTGSDAKLFPTSYMRFHFGVATTPGKQTVAFARNSSISLKAYGNFGFKVDKEAFK
ncbi:MAG: hypothetical protein ACP5MI_00275 [Candidatus Kryptoniota bacterium]